MLHIENNNQQQTAKAHSLGYRLVRLGGMLISLLALIWVLKPIISNARQLIFFLADIKLIYTLIFGCLSYVCLTVLMALAWWWLGSMHRKNISIYQGYAVWARSQIAKYLPGNVFHYLGRHILGRRLDISHQALIFASFFEMICMILAATAISLTGMAILQTSILTRTALIILMAAVTLTVVIWPLINNYIRRAGFFSERVKGLPELSYPQLGKLILPAVVLHALFLLGTGWIMYLLLQQGWPQSELSGNQVVWVYALAWLLGTVTIGASGGIGVREAAVIIILGPHIGQAEAALLALAMRMITLLGDLVTALLGYAIRLPKTSQALAVKDAPCP